MFDLFDKAKHFLTKGWWGRIVVYGLAIVTIYSGIWGIIEPIGIPDKLTCHEIFQSRIFYHLIVTLFLATNITLAFELILLRKRWKGIPVETMPSNSTQIQGTYEWQWAGENWIGYVSIENSNKGESVANINVMKVIKGEPKSTPVQIITSSSSGKAISDNGTLELYLPVQKTILNKNQGIARRANETLEASLQSVRAYAGVVKYRTQDGRVSEGDMILVDYKSTSRFGHQTF